MKLLATIELLSYWHAGTGLGLGVVADAATLKDENRLPYLPGKSIKGLFREAFNILEETGNISQNTTEQLFGTATTPDSDPNLTAESGCCFFSNGNLSKNLIQSLMQNPNQKECLYSTIAQTKLDDNGIAVDQTLRTIEVCMPVTMFSLITVDKDDRKYETYFQQAATLIKGLGSHRHRGLGRCKISISRINQ